MSTIRVDNFQASDGLTPAFSAAGIPKAHFQYDQDGVATILGSLNITSIADLGTGSYSPTFTNNFAAATYSTSSCAGRVGGGVNETHGIGALTTSTNLGQIRADNVVFDVAFVGAMHTGDLA